MTSVDITWGFQDKLDKEQFDTHVISLIGLKIKTIDVVRTLVLSTESNSWLKDAEQNG
jgi:hypothetical protein